MIARSEATLLLGRPRACAAISGQIRCRRSGLLRRFAPRNDKLGNDKLGNDKSGNDKLGDDKLGNGKLGNGKLGDGKLGDDKLGNDKLGNDNGYYLQVRRFEEPARIDDP